jgi:hypothetical protein
MFFGMKSGGHFCNIDHFIVCIVIVFATTVARQTRNEKTEEEKAVHSNI